MTFFDSSSADVTQHFMKTTTLKKTTCFCSRLNVTESQLSCLSRRGMGNFHHCLIFWHCGTWKDKQVRSVWKPFLGGGLISRLDTMTRCPWRDSDAVWGWSTCERRSARSDRWCSVLRRHSVELFASQNNKKNNNYHKHMNHWHIFDSSLWSHRRIFNCWRFGTVGRVGVSIWWVGNVTQKKQFLTLTQDSNPALRYNYPPSCLCSTNMKHFVTYIKKKSFSRIITN